MPDGTQQERFGQKKQGKRSNQAPRRTTGEGKQIIEAVIMQDETG
jgi:hypothetical protein